MTTSKMEISFRVSKYQTQANSKAKARPKTIT